MFHDDKQFSFLPALKCVFNYTLHTFLHLHNCCAAAVRGVNSIYSPSHAFTHASNHDLSGDEKKTPRSRTSSLNYVRKFIRFHVRLQCAAVSECVIHHFTELIFFVCCWVSLSFKMWYQQPTTYAKIK